MKKLLSVPVAIFSLILSIAVALGIIHITNFIYKIDINALDISEKSGYSKEVVTDNVDAVMKYLSPFSDEEFHLPDLEYSEVGASHFADCKIIFDFLYLFGALSFVVLILIFVFLKPDRKTMRISSVLILAIPTVVLIAIAIDFDFAFVLFHKVLFTNSDWLFDPVTDPIIELLPAEYFMHCGIFIAVIVLCTAIIIFFTGKKEKGKNFCIETR